MRSIGFRASPSCVYYCIVEEATDEYQLLDVNNIIVPKKTEMGFQLRHIRTNIISILSEYDINKVGIRGTENNAQKISIPRTYIEGVILESLQDSNIDRYFMGTKSKIATLLGEDVKNVTKYINNEMNFRGIVDWDNYSTEQRETIITAIAAIQM